jgi:hypothetical protein
MHRDSTFYYKLTYSTADGSSSSEYSEYETSESTTPVGYFTKTAATSWSMVSTKAINKFIFDDNLYYPDLRTQTNAFTDMVLDYTVSGYIVTRMLSLGGYINETTSRSNLTWNFEIKGSRGAWYQYGASLSCKPAVDSQTVTPAVTIAADYIDYAQDKRYNMDGSQSAVTLPELSIYAGANTLSVGTTVQPSTVSITGRGISEE